jgi:hypothetical protein
MRLHVTSVIAVHLLAQLVAMRVLEVALADLLPQTEVDGMTG